MPAQPRYSELPAPAALAGRLRCSWQHRQGTRDGSPLVLPDGCVDLIWDGRRLQVAGPDRVAMQAQLRAGDVLTGVRLAAGCGAALLGLPLERITDQRMALKDLWGSRARRWEQRLRDGASPAATLHALCASAAIEPDRRMAWLFEQLAGDAGTSITSLAATLGVSARSLRRHCQQAFGYGPKTLARILRLQRFLRIAGGHPTLTAGALAAGYGDAAHLVRDARQLTGLTPGALVRGHVG